MPKKLQWFGKNFKIERIEVTSLSISSWWGRLKFLFLVLAISFLLLHCFDLVHIKDYFRLFWGTGFTTLSSSFGICRLKGDIIARYFNVVLFILYFDTNLLSINIKLLILVCMSSFTIPFSYLDKYFSSSLNSHQTFNKYNGDVVIFVFSNILSL